MVLVHVPDMSGPWNDDDDDDTYTHTHTYITIYIRFICIYTDIHIFANSPPIPPICAQPMLLHCLESLKVSGQTIKEIFGTVTRKFPAMTI